MGQIITFMSYNIKVGSWTPRGLDAVAEVIAAVNPDVVALQEVDQGMARTKHVDQTAWLSQRLGYDGIFAPAAGGEAFGASGGAYGIAMLSRHPIIDHTRRLLYHQPLPVAERPPRYHVEQRAVLGCLIEIDGTPVNVFCTHFDLAADQRIHQADDVVNLYRAWHADHPAVLMGDFNADLDSPEIATIRRALRDVFLSEGVSGEERITFPSGPLGSRTENGWVGAIDYAFVSEHWRIDDITVIRETEPASDHAPVILRVEL